MAVYWKNLLDGYYWGGQIGYMKYQCNQRGEATAGRASVVSRFFLVSAFLGLLVGVFEASLLWTTPRIIPLLVPDVGWVVWFLAPLVDMIFFGLVGFGLGLLASRTAHGEVFVAANAGVAITFVYLMVKWFHTEIGLHPFHPAMELLVPMMVFTAGFTVSLVVLAFVWSRLSAFADRWLSKLRKPLAWGVAGASAVSIVGIGVFVIWPPTSGPAAPTVAPPPRGAPNIVFITLDTVRADHLSSYGYSRPTTPNIDRFARTGVLYENAIAASSWTLASHASMFTGLLPQQHGADFTVPLASNPWTLAEALRSQGYQTAGFIGNNLFLERGWGIAKGFGSYEDYSTYIYPNLDALLLGNAVLQPLYQNFVRFDDFDRENARQLNGRIFRWFPKRKQRPYFAFINYFDAHLPYITSQRYNHRFGSASMELERKLIHSLRSGKEKVLLTGEERKSLVAAYDNCLSYLDSQVEDLLNFLRRSPGWQNTIVIITSDHGEEFGRHLSYEHGRNLSRGVLHVPLIVAGPGVPKGMRVRHVVATRELFSTILDLAGHGHTPFSRTSLARFWNPRYKPLPSDNAVVSELVPIFDVGAQRSMISLTTPEWDYVAHRGGRQELYNWKTDPEEKDNLATSPGEETTLEGLRSRLVRLVSNATGPWHGPEYLEALDWIKGPARLGLLRPQPFQHDAAGSSIRIGIAQAFFEADESAPTHPSRSERDALRSLPYQ